MSKLNLSASQWAALFLAADGELIRYGTRWYSGDVSGTTVHALVNHGLVKIHPEDGTERAEIRLTPAGRKALLTSGSEV